jgi:hypothetical protein
MEHESSLPSSQELSACTCIEPDLSSQHHPILSVQDPSQCYLPIYVLVFLVVSFPVAFLSVTYTRSSCPPFAVYPRFANSNYTWRRVQIVHLVMQLSPPHCHFIPLQSKYSPQHPVLKHPQSMFLPLCQRQSFTHIQNRRQNYSLVYSNLLKGDEKTQGSELNGSKHY